MRLPRLLLATAVAGTVVMTGVGGSVQAAQNPRCTAQTSNAGNGWQAITPNFTQGSSNLQQVVGVPYAPDRIYATNGTQLLRTEDAGCHWQDITPTMRSGSLGVLPDPLDTVLQVPA